MLILWAALGQLGHVVGGDERQHSGDGGLLLNASSGSWSAPFVQRSVPHDVAWSHQGCIPVVVRLQVGDVIGHHLDNLVALPSSYPPLPSSGGNQVALRFQCLDQVLLLRRLLPLAQSFLNNEP